MPQHHYNSSMTRHICMITGSRAEWGILHSLYEELQQTDVRLELVITGSHLHSQSSFSVAEIEADTGQTHRKIYITPENLPESGNKAMFITMAQALERFSDYFIHEKPDLVIYYGDRYEIYAAATACRLCGLKSAHISGGEITTGAFDDVLRHCLSKLSDLHFTATEEFRRRVIQLGENPEFVFNTGDLALAGLDKLPYLERSQLECELKCELNEFFLITLHPETCRPGRVLAGAKLLLPFLRQHYPSTKLLITGANADPEGEKINAWLKQQAKRDTEHIYFYAGLGRLRYLSAAHLARCVIGNSSSGIIELPSLGIPVLDLGNRQQGRLRSDAVLSADFTSENIANALNKLLNPDWLKKCATIANPYEGKDSAKTIARIIKEFDLSLINRDKVFFDLPISL